MKRIITSILLLSTVMAKSQIYVLDQFSGQPVVARLYENIQGTALLYDEWKYSEVTDNKGNTFLNVLIRFDVYANKFYYNHGDTAYEFITPITEIKIFPEKGDTTVSKLFKKGYTIQEKITPDKFVQVLAEGKIVALKLISKSIAETSEYNVPGKIKIFQDKNVYYFIKNGIIELQKPGLKFLESLTTDKWGEVEKYMKSFSLSPKTDEGFSRLISYYNSL